MPHPKTLEEPGDPASTAFEELVDRFRRPLLTFFSRRTSDGGTAENLLQETFLRAYRYWHTYDPSRRLSAWMFTIATNIHRDWLAEEPRHRAAPLTEHPDPGEASDPEGVVITRDCSEALIRAVMELPDKYRAVLVKKHYQRLKYTQIAAELGLEEGTVKSRLNTATGLLREKLARRGFVP